VNLMRAHVCQDQFGFWFVTLEYDDGTLQRIEHGATKEHADESAWHVASTIVTDPEPWRPFPPGGVALGYHPPEPRRALGA
jgi:hypothetical protein